MAQAFRQFPLPQRKARLLSGTTDPAADVDLWLRPDPQPLRRAKKQAYQVSSRYAPRVLATSTTTQTVTAQARIGLNPAIQSGWSEPTNQPLRKRIPKRQQPFYPTRRFLTLVATTQTITAKANITALTAVVSSSWQEPINQFLRARVPKRQQPRYPFGRYLATVTTTQTITAKANIAGQGPGNTSSLWKKPTNQPYARRKRILQSAEVIVQIGSITQQLITARANIISISPANNIGLWKQPTNQPLRKRVPKRMQLPRPTKGNFLSTVTTTQTITAVANIRSLSSVVSSAWKQPVNQPLRSRIPRRQQPLRVFPRYAFTSVQTITAKANIAGLPLGWIRPTNQPLRNRIPKRQQPLRVFPRYAFTTIQTITAKANIAGQGPANTVTYWVHPTNQPLKNRVPKRQQPQYPSRRFVITGVQTITAKANIRGLVTVVSTAWQEPINQFLRKRVPKRQQPFYPTRRFLTLTTSSQTITAKANITSLVTVNVETWKQPVNQPLRKRVPKRQQPQYPSKRFIVSQTNTQTITAKANIRGNTTQTITARASILPPVATDVSKWINYFVPSIGYLITLPGGAEWLNSNLPPGVFGGPSVPSTPTWQITPPSAANWQLKS